MIKWLKGYFIISTFDKDISHQSWDSNLRTPCSIKIPSFGTSTQHISNIEKVIILYSYFLSNMFDYVTDDTLCTNSVKIACLPDTARYSSQGSSHSISGSRFFFFFLLFFGLCFVSCSTTSNVVSLLCGVAYRSLRI